MQFSHDNILFLSLISLGFFGGFSHCIGMCGPFVITQTSNRLKNIKIDNNSEFQKLAGLALIPYHLGRATTYSIIGGLLSLLSLHFKQTYGFKIFSAAMLIIAALIFMHLMIAKIKLPFKLSGLKIPVIFSTGKLLRNLFFQPLGWNGYILGILLGFIPCGLLYGAFLIAATINNFLLAMLAMFTFSLANIPALFATACGGYWLFNSFANKLQFLTKVILLVNSITLFLMAIGLIFNKI